MKLNCPKCNAKWEIINNIVEATCGCFQGVGADNLRHSANKSWKYKTLETPFGKLKIGSLHPFGVSVSKDGFSPLIGFSWGLTEGWKLQEK